MRRALSLGLAVALGAALTIPGGVAAAPRRPAAGAFLLVTMDKHVWRPYEYGSAFFFNRQGEAYTASHVVEDVVRSPNVMLVAVVNGMEYAARVECWNPSRARAGVLHRDVAIVRVGPEVPLFPLWRFRPAVRPLLAVPLPIRTGPVPAASRVRLLGFGRSSGRPSAQRQVAGRLAGARRSADGAEILSTRFPAYAAPADGDSGGPVLDLGGNVIGLAAWQREIDPDTVEMDAVAASSFGCVTALPANRNDLNPVDTPVTLPVH
ncbi:MAG TPA: serine protease [bacterium]|nr:serine protease [bacterium]